MIRYLAIIFAAFVLAGHLPVAGAGPAISTPSPLLNDAAAGQALAAELRGIQPLTNAEFRGRLKIRQREGTISTLPIFSRITVNGTSWQVSYLATWSNRAELLVVTHAKGQTNQYHLAQQQGTSHPPENPPPCDQLWLPFAGSDFFLADLGLEFLHWPRQVLVQNEMRKNRACHVLESRPAVTNAYARVVSWVDVETGGLVMAEAFNAGNQRIKEFEVKSFKKLGDQWQLQEMEMRSPRNRSRTSLEFDVSPE